jgi:hypothetical protein
MNKKILFCLLAIFLCMNGCRSLTVSSTAVSNKTVIKSEIVKLGTVSMSTPASPKKPKRVPARKDATTFTIAVQKDLIIQCKKLILNRNIDFIGSDVNIIIEYETLLDNFHTVNAALGSKGSFRFERKKFE